MTDTPNLALPYILASQAQKHVTHNEAIRALDCLVQLSVESRVLTSPPASPADGSRYVIAAGASGDWAGQGNKVAAFQDGAWAFYAPKDGWISWVASENIFIVYDAATWTPLPTGGVTDHGMLTGLGDDDHLQYLTNARGDARYTPVNPSTLGINATADTTNRLALSSPASLFSHDGNGHQVKVNKHAASDTASFLFQDNFSGRAEIGLAGDDDFHFKVSPDGSTWFEGIKIGRATGKVSFPNSGGPRELLTANRTYYVRTDGSDSNTGLVNTSGGAFLTLQKAIDTVATLDLSIFNVTVSVGAGTYTGGISVTAPWIGAGTVSFVGDATTPSNCTISTTSAHCVNVTNGAIISISGFKITSTAAYGVVVVGGQVNVTGKIEYGEFGSGIQNFISNGGKLNCYADYIINGSASRHIYMDGSGCFFQAVGNNVTVKRSPAFSAAFCSVGNYGQLTAYGQTYSYPAITCTIASPGVITYAGHGISANAPVAFATTGALPTGITAGTTYYIKTVLDANTFTISATPGGTVINTSGSQSGTHTLIATGVRYNVGNLGTIETAGGGTTYFPGNAAGSGTNPATSPYGYYR